MKYLELIKGQFTADHEARAKQQEPYVAYSEEAGGVMYTFIPEPVVGPADNEIWYTTTDGEVTACMLGQFNSYSDYNSYEGVGKWGFESTIHIISVNSYSYSPCFGGVSIDEGIYNYTLSSIILPNSVKQIGEKSFGMLQGLTEISLPSSIEEISIPFMQNNTGVEITYRGTKAQWNQISFSEYWNYNNGAPLSEKVVQIVHCTDGDITV